MWALFINHGNIARKLFSNATTSVEITVFDKTLINGCPTSKLIRKNKKVPPGESYSLITAYPWYYLPATINNVITNGAADRADIDINCKAK